MIWFALKASSYNGRSEIWPLQGTRITKRGFLFSVLGQIWLS